MDDLWRSLAEIYGENRFVNQFPVTAQPLWEAALENKSDREITMGLSKTKARDSSFMVDLAEFTRLCVVTRADLGLVDRYQAWQTWCLQSDNPELHYSIRRAGQACHGNKDIFMTHYDTMVNRYIKNWGLMKPLPDLLPSPKDPAVARAALDAMRART